MKSHFFTTEIDCFAECRQSLKNTRQRLLPNVTLGKESSMNCTSQRILCRVLFMSDDTRQRKVVIMTLGNGDGVCAESPALGKGGRIESVWHSAKNFLTITRQKTLGKVSSTR
jgi:hypothetical protein